MDRKKIIIAVLIFIILGTATAYKLLSKRPTGLSATGTIEVTRADIMPKTNGYLKDYTLQKGDFVTTGQLIAKLARPDLEAQLLRDEAGLAKAAAQLRDLESGARSQELSVAEAGLQSAEAQYQKAHADLERYRALHASGAISDQQLETARLSDKVCADAVRSASANLSQLLEGNRKEQIEAQRLEVQRSKAILAASKAALEDACIASPLSGLVLSKNFEAGEYVNPGAAIATIGDMNDCWVKIYIPSEQLGLLRVGQAATIRVDSFPEKNFSGSIKEIAQSAEFTPRQSITPKERANQVFAVKVKLENGNGLFKPGMPADVVFP